MTEFVLVVALLLGMWLSTLPFEPMEDPLTPEQQKIVDFTNRLQAVADSIGDLTKRVQESTAAIRAMNEAMKEERERYGK